MCRSFQVEWGWKGGSHGEIMQLAQHHTVRLSSHFTVIFKSYIKKNQHVFRKLSSAYLFHACSHLYKWRSEFCIFISKIELLILWFLLFILSLFFMQWTFYNIQICYRPCPGTKNTSMRKESLCLPGTHRLMRETGM